MSAELRLAGRVLELVRGSVGPAAEAEVTVEYSESGLTRFANSFIHQNVADTATVVSVRLHHDGRTSSGSTTRLDDAGLRTLIERVRAAASLLPPDPLWGGVTPPTGLTMTGVVDETTAGAAPSDRADRVRAFVNHAEGLLTAGFCRTSLNRTAFGNTAGHLVVGAYTEASMDGVARSAAGTVPADGVARAASVRLSDIDGAVLGARAAAKARAAVDPTDVPPGRYEVVLEPLAVGDLLEAIGRLGFNGKAIAEHRSFAVVGETQFDSALSIVDDATAPDSIGLPFDAEGTPKRRLVFVDGGRTCAIAHDRRTARELGAQTTGHAVPGGEQSGPDPLHLGIEPPAHRGGPATEVDGPMVDSDVEQLVAGVDRGLLVTDFWYTRVLDPRPLVLTGLTRNGIWLIEDGAVTRPVTNLRFTQAYPQALAPGQVLGIGRHAATMVPNWSSGPYRAPALRLASWNFTGGAAG